MISALLLAATITAGTPVIAVVDDIKRNAMTEHLDNGELLTWTVVEMTIVQPKEGTFGTKFTAYCPGPPFVGRDHMWVGQYVTFRMPEQASQPAWLESLDVQSYMAEGSIPTAAALRIFEEARVAAADDDEKLWGRSLYGPLMLVDPKTRYLIRNDRFVDQLPPEIGIANTATLFRGELTTMIQWTSLQGLTSTQRRRLLMHECFHRIQKEIGFPAGNENNEHLDTVDGRVWLQLELRALASALRAAGEARTRALTDAVSYRAARRAAFPGAAEKERGLENNEGLAEYTGWALRGTTAEESRLTLARRLEKLDPNTSFVRSFAYETGPAYGLMLDVLKPGWTRGYKVSDDLADVLAVAGGLKPAAPQAYAYDATALRASEETRDRDNRERIARYRARLVEGPVLELPMKGANFVFDPNKVTPLAGAGNAYPALEVSAEWGRLKVDNGARITSDWSTIFVPAADRAKLELKPGWQVVAGKRDGDLRVVPPLIRENPPSVACRCRLRTRRLIFGPWLRRSASTLSAPPTS